jgi:hypothetical protein
MYSGTTFRNNSGNLIGGHQRLDRLARRHLDDLPRDITFPSIKEILYFEGNNGPDGVKRKSPSVDEPWHFINPEKEQDTDLITMIMDHVQNLTTALQGKNQERAAFEAAWLAHAVVDGLTPAHHFPLGDKIEELFGKPHTERLTVRDKNIIKGSTRRDTISKNWEYWGSGGIFSAHLLFELGVSTTMIGRRYDSLVTQNDIATARLQGYEVIFRDVMKQIYDLRVFDKYRRQGWNLRMTRLVNKKLIPLILKGVTLAWYAAILKAEHES